MKLLGDFMIWQIEAVKANTGKKVKFIDGLGDIQEGWIQGGAKEQNHKADTAQTHNPFYYMVTLVQKPRRAPDSMFSGRLWNGSGIWFAVDPQRIIF